MSEKSIQKKVQSGLLPILDYACLHDQVLDLQEVFSRLMFDEVSIMILGYDPRSLAIEFPLVKAEKAFKEVMESIFYRNIVPIWNERMMMTDQNGKMVYDDDKFIRDFAFNLYAAGRDTITSGLTWFFWLVATHPSVEAKILVELEENFGTVDGKKHQVLGIEDVKKLIYLHGALCESLRLFPPIS
ncbi:hypothetical protein PIB30_036577 [Stylosanthes scabra]|uniref:Cytochrome P450 n=1 Tax=Stylosanthes scabra TaxID=79078 RepID=A0ABU6YCA7_9FABA|nr:hypothetical protein [Stylosanthes scabra]